MEVPTGAGVHRAVWLPSPSLLAWAASFSPLFSALATFWVPSHSFLPPPNPIPIPVKGDCVPTAGRCGSISSGRHTPLVLPSTKLGWLRPLGPQFPYLLTEG